MDLSIVVPAYNEDESIRELLAEIKPVVTQEGYTWELIFIDPGKLSRNCTRSILK